MMRRRIHRATWTALSLFAAACGITGPDFETDGIVRFVDVEGGCWVIDAGEATLEPINLTEDFRSDGLRVSFVAEQRNDLASICQVGQLVELSSIRVRDG